MSAKITLGLMPLKAEGQAMHPDHLSSDLTDDQYVVQLQAYKDWAGDNVYETSCVRDNLLKYLK